MFDSLFNLVIILIPLAIFIGRIVVQARSKHSPPPKPQQPHIAIHFEDDTDDDPAYFKNLAARGSAKTPSLAHAARTQTLLAPKKEETPFPKAASGLKSPAAVKQTGAGAVSPGQAGFTAALTHLSPLKQAVVMAEILGPPKGML